MADNTSSYPYDTVVMITNTIGSQSWQASGVLISPDEVLTASHVVYIQGVGTANDIVVTPGYNDGSGPYGSADGTYFHYFPIDDANRFITNQQSQYDYAGIHLSTLAIWVLRPTLPGDQ
jgi:V8-like Glu-specific endopeptidase